MYVRMYVYIGSLIDRHCESERINLFMYVLPNMYISMYVYVCMNIPSLTMRSTFIYLHLI